MVSLQSIIWVFLLNNFIRAKNLLLTKLARDRTGRISALGLFVRTSPRCARSVLYLGPIFSQYGPRAWLIRYMYLTILPPTQHHSFFRNLPPFLSSNRPRSIYQYSSMAPRLSGQNCKFFEFLLSLNRPIATNNHIVQNPPCWRANSLLLPHWDVKTYRPQPVKRDWPLFLCPSAAIIMSLPSSLADFVPCDRLLQ